MEKKKLICAYDRFVKSVVNLKKTDGNDFFDQSKYKVLTFLPSETFQDDTEDMEIDNLEDENDDDYEDIPDEVIFSPVTSKLLKNRFDLVV